MNKAPISNIDTQAALEEKNKAAVNVLLKNITSALLKRNAGESLEYEKLMYLFNQSPSSMLGVWFTALSQCANLVTECGQDLINTIIQFNYEENNEIITAFIEFLVNIAAVNQVWAGAVLQKLVQSFTPSNQNKHIFANGEQVDFYFDAIQSAIFRITSISPSSCFLLYNKLVELYPHKSLPVFNQEMYLNNVLILAKKYPNLREKIITLILDKIIQIDVEIGDDEEEEDLMFELDASQAEQSTQKEMTEKLDTMIFQMLNFIEQTSLEGKKEMLNEVFEILLKTFDRSILPSSSRFIQFVIFYMCSKEDYYSQRFLSQLFSTVLTITQFTSTMSSYSPKLFAQPATGFSGQYSKKESCILFAGSFIARMKSMSVSVVSNSCCLLANWAIKYIEQNPLAQPDVPSHSLFYLIVHCLFYVLCFRFDQILDAYTRDEVISTFRLTNIIQSKLNPLRVLPKSVTNEFIATLKSKKITDLASMCEGVIFRPSSSMNYLSPKNNSNHEKVTSLDNYIDLRYPFDPYPFPKASSFIDPVYNSWSGNKAESTQKVDNDNSSDDEDDSLSSSSHKHSTSFSDDDIAMSFTPDTAFDIDYHFSHSPFKSNNF